MSRTRQQLVEPIPAPLADAVAATMGVYRTNAPKADTPAQKSPLRYPGGKTRAVKEIIKYFPPDLERVCSPFLGGGSIELELAHRGVQVFGYDIFKPLTVFWQELLTEPHKLAALVRKYRPLTSSKFYSLQLGFGDIKDKREMAAVFFVLNRASFSGTTLSGGMSPGHTRFTKAIIERLENFKAPNLHVANADFHVSLAKHKDDFLYLDPPYANGDGKEGLYGIKGDTHEDFDHEGLAAILNARKGWILSYNDKPKVRAWYKGHKMLTPSWAYGMNNDKKSNELLIFSHDFIEV